MRQPELRALIVTEKVDYFQAAIGLCRLVRCVRGADLRVDSLAVNLYVKKCSRGGISRFFRFFAFVPRLPCRGLRALNCKER